MDATALQFPANTFNAICTDLPWGQLVGSHQHNADLYPRVLAEAARVAAPRARLVLLTHESNYLRAYYKTVRNGP